MERRKFIGAGLAATIAFTVVPGHVLGGSGRKSPSDKLNIAGVGIAAMGAANLSHVENENIVALCDVDRKYGSPIFEKYPKARHWDDYRRMQEEQKDIEHVECQTNEGCKRSYGRSVY